MNSKYNIDDIIYEARIGVAKDFAQKFYASTLDSADSNEKNDTNSSKSLAEILLDRKKILDGYINVAKKYI